MKIEAKKAPKRSPDKIHPNDYVFAPADPDPDFNPEHNRRVIQDVIRKTNQKILRNKSEYNEEVRQRAAAATYWLKAQERGVGAMSIEQYFGKTELNRLRGAEILEKLKSEFNKQ